MSNMFSGCSSLKELNFNNFKTNKSNKIYRMFSGCSEEFITKIKKENKDIKMIAFK